MNKKITLIENKKNLQPKKQRYFTFIKSTWVILLLVSFFSWQCKKVDSVGGTEGVCPEVIATDPINGAINVATNKKISVTFNEAMNPATITTVTMMIKEGNVPIAGTISYSGNTAVFTPTINLKGNTVYTGTITTGVKDLAKNSMLNDYVWSFNTGNTPTVVSTDPINGAVNVQMNKLLMATFSTAMDPLTINSSTYLLRQGNTLIGGSVTYSGMVGTFTPTIPLSPNTVYVATITTNSKDVAGNAMSSNYSWSFVTGTGIAPTVISTDPANNATNVPTNKIIRASFSTSMDASTITGTSYVVKQNNITVLGSVTYAGTTASFTPSSALLNNTVYTATISTAVKDATGNSLANIYTWSFTTTTAPPTVISTDPANGATSVALNKIISATFNTVMDASTMNVLSFQLSQNGNQVFGTVNYSGNTASFTPANGLMSNTVYTATINTLAKDAAGNALSSNYVWSFTTLFAVIPPPPPILGNATPFGAFGGSAGITNQGLNTVINGSLGTTAVSTAVTGFNDQITGDIYTQTPLNVGRVTNRIYTNAPFPGTPASFAIATAALLDANAAYISLSPAMMPGGVDPGAGELGGLTLTPGIYKSASGTFKISTGNLTLDAQGNPNAVWVFQTAAGLTVGVAGPTGAKSVNLVNGGLARNVYWQVGSAAIINGAGGGIMTGTIISSAGVTFSTAGNAVQTVLNGRALSLNASVTMVNTTINVPN